MDTACVHEHSHLCGNFTKWFDRQVWWQWRLRSSGLHRRVTLSKMATHTNTHSGSVFQTKPVTCVMSTAGWAMVHVLPRLLLLVIHKLRPTPVVWCHLHHLPEAVRFNMGPLLFHRALCWGVGLHVLYLCSHVFICLCSCVCERESVKGRERVCCYAFLHVLPLLSSHETSWQWQIEHLKLSHFPGHNLAGKHRKPLCSIRGRAHSWVVLILWGKSAWTPLKCLLFCSITLMDSSARAMGKDATVF